jgi:hypothetical protein
MRAPKISPEASTVYIVTSDEEAQLLVTERWTEAVRYACDLSTNAAAINQLGEEGGRTLLWTAEDGFTAELLAQVQ